MTTENICTEIMVYNCYSSATAYRYEQFKADLTETVNE